MKMLKMLKPFLAVIPSRPDVFVRLGYEGYDYTKFYPVKMKDPKPVNSDPEHFKLLATYGWHLSTGRGRWVPLALHGSNVYFVKVLENDVLVG